MHPDGLGLPRSSRRGGLWWLLAGVGLTAALSVPALWIPFDPDEHVVLGGMDGSPWMGTKFDLYRFSTGRPEDVQSLMERGAVPWFTSSEWKYALWRPLTSALFVADRAISGWNRVGYQVHSLLWSLALVAVCGVLFRRVLPAVPAAAALLVFAASVFHAEPAGWITARHILVSAVLGFSGVLCHVRWRQDGWRAGAWLSVPLLAIALLASEAALQPIGYLVAFELLGNRSWRSRVLGLAPCTAVVLVYFVLYRFLGRGTNEGLGYVDPFAQPGLFLARGWGFLGCLLTRLATQLDPGPWARPVLFPAVWIVGRALVRLPERERSAAAWLGFGSVLSLLPVLGGYPEDRVLLAPSAGVAVLAVAAVRLGWATLHEPGSLLRPRELLLVVLCGLVCLVHVVLAPVRLPLRFVAFGRLAEQQMEAIRAVHNEGCAPWDVIVINSPDWAVGLHGGYVRERESGTPPRRWTMLSMTTGQHEIRRTCARTFELSLADGRPFEIRWFRDPVRHPMQVGEVVVQCGARLRVTAVANGSPTRLQVSLDRSLEDRTLQFVGMQGGSLRRITMPAVGDVVRTW